MVNAQTIGTVILTVIASIVGFYMGPAVEDAMKQSEYLYDETAGEFTNWGGLGLLFYYLAIVLLPIGVLFAVVKGATK